MTALLYVALGGAVGASLRYLSGIALMRLFGSAFPYGTLFVNIVGSFAMGVAIVWLSKRMGASSNELRLFLTTGLLGGFTTFSAFSLDFANLWERGDTMTAFIYVLLSVIVSIVAIFAGMWLARSFA